MSYLCGETMKNFTVIFVNPMGKNVEVVFAKGDST